MKPTLQLSTQENDRSRYSFVDVLLVTLLLRDSWSVTFLLFSSLVLEERMRKGEGDRKIGRQAGNKSLNVFSASFSEFG